MITMKANKLTQPNIHKVDAVPAGANQGARICLFKSRTGDFAARLAEDMTAAIAKADARTVAALFDSKAKETIVNRRIDECWWPFSDTMRQSIQSILLDNTLTDEQRASMLQKSFDEFGARLIPMLTAPGTAVAKAGRKVSGNAQGDGEDFEDEDTMDDEDMMDEDEEDSGDDDGTDDEEGSDGSGAAKKSRTEEFNNMKIDKSKLTPEEATQFDALLTKCREDGDPAPAAQPAATGISPEVQKALDTANATMKEGLERINKAIDANDIKELTVVCKKYEAIPQGAKAEEIAQTVFTLRKANQAAAADAMIKSLDATLQAVQKSGVFQENGGSGSNGGQNPAEVLKTRAHKIMDEAVAKGSGAKMTYSKAFTQACAELPEVVKEYEASLQPQK